ncbi:P-loop containing nucleoside triphosphate hydrolase protein [Dunaliella salina]|uniref:P-loop containing nucleoside triphosphate hydrolase protein n=1 Tax=Dunaliella salina TaxID=3046 RepID=A0ABQ7G1T4_DUNSA|nr:P-loop containing nucleoside triphosphate hydrolase protein [Dunaliella salina]|eukprot:KAF5828550.1 P-loop containing nucleoside triphosphate hydrolase protein [Dunaliella salina]
MTKDTEAIDLMVGGSVSSALTCMVNAVLSMVVVCVVSPVAIAALGPLLLFYWRVQAVYIASSRELKRLDSLAFSPIFQHYSESLQGLITIRAFKKQPMFLQKNRANLDHSNRAYWPIQVVNRWLSVRLEMMGAFIVFVTTLCVAVLLPANPGISGLAITSALNLTGWEEAPALLPDSGLPPDWPSEGVIEARALTVKYRPELPAVLKGLSFSVRGKEKVGVCGRTGCGKSTLMITLYRLVEPTSGFIFVDGIDITTLGLADLRSRLSLVPQDPVIFSGTIRSNLDPFATAASDAHIWEALARAGMDSFVAGLDGGLNAPIQEGGANLSTGQRQLLCMARALLRASRILVLDEATSNVDNTTDALIQRTIRSAFSQCTVLTIAHRLHTIIDSDRVLLLEGGMLKEFDTPHALMATPGSSFRALVEETTGAGGPGAQGVILVPSRLPAVRQ